MIFSVATNVATILRAIAWPVVALVAIVVFRRRLPELFSHLARRTTKLSILQFGIELTPLSEDYSGRFISAIHEAGSFVNTASGLEQLFKEMENLGALDFALIDLGSGRRWLTSRLYIFALMLKRMRGVKCLVFVRTAPDGSERGQFVGLATPEAVRWALARRYLYLEQAFAAAYGERMDEMKPITSLEGGLAPLDAGTLITGFATLIQRDPSPPATEGGAPPAEEGPWEFLEQLGKWERAEWLTWPRLEQILGAEPPRVVSVAPHVPQKERVAAVIRSGGRFVPLVMDGGRFAGLADRERLLEQLASEHAD